VSGADVIIAVLVATAVSFDFTNGFHDTTSPPRTSMIP
jgi:phosphate/sulfate permease